MSERLNRFVNGLSERGFESALIHRNENVRYLSGFKGEGLLLVTRGKAYIVTDFRYEEQAHREAGNIDIVIAKVGEKYEDVAASLIDGDGLVAYEDDVVTVATFFTFAEHVKSDRLKPLGDMLDIMRRVKSLDEINAIEKSCAIACDAFESILRSIKPGVTERQIALSLEIAMRERGADAVSFPIIAASGPNGSLPHAVPSDRPIERGEFLTLDFGALYNGYCSDVTRTVAIGSVSDDKRRVYETVLTAQLLALDAIEVGKTYKEIDTIARTHIEEAGYKGMFGHGLGHSLGLAIHENPRFSPAVDSSLTIEPNVIMTVEPGIYRAGIDGVRIEDTVHITENGAKRLTKTSKELIIL